MLYSVSLGPSTALGQDSTAQKCQETLASPKAAVSYAGAVSRLNLPADQWNCFTGAKSEVDWVSVSVIPPGSNDPPVLQYAVQPNLSSHPRQGSIAAGGQELTIAQEAGPPPGIAGPSRLDWVAHQNGEDPEKQILRVGSDDPDLEFAAVPSRRTVAWLAVKNSGEKGSFEVTITWRTLKPGTYMGEIVVHAAGARNDPLSIPVSLKIIPEVGRK